MERLMSPARCKIVADAMTGMAALLQDHNHRWTEPQIEALYEAYRVLGIDMPIQFVRAQKPKGDLALAGGTQAQPATGEQPTA